MMARMEKGLSWRKVGVSALVAVAIGLIVAGFATGVHGDAAIVLPPEVEQVVPKPGDLVLRQSEVGIDLKPGYRGVLVIDGQEIGTTDLSSDATQAAPAGAPHDAVFDPAQNTVHFQPRQGATIEEFAPGSHEITAIYWKLDQTRDSAKQFSWRFQVS
jgi:hypothetical protein